MMIITKAMAIDPGGSTGMAMVMHNTITSEEHILTTTVPSHDGEVENVVDMIMNQRPQVIIVERFLSRGMLSRYGIETLHLIGTIKGLWYVARAYNTGDENGKNEVFPRFEIVWRTPAQRTIYIPRAKRAMDERKKAGVCKSFTDHEVDALAHLLGWMDARSST